MDFKAETCCKCDKEVIVEEGYCSNCGQKLDWESDGE